MQFYLRPPALLEGPVNSAISFWAYPKNGTQDLEILVKREIGNLGPIS